MCSLTDKPAVLLSALIVSAKNDQYKFVTALGAEIITRENDMLISYITSASIIDPCLNLSKLAKKHIDFYYDAAPEGDKQSLASILATFFSVETPARKVWIALRYLAEVMRFVRRCAFDTKKGGWSVHLMWLQTANLPATVLRNEFTRMLAAFQDMKISKPEISFEDLKKRALEIDAKCLGEQMFVPRY